MKLELLQEALEYSLEEFKMISSIKNQYNRIIEECHIQAAIYSYLRGKGLAVQIESNYPAKSPKGRSSKCDLRIVEDDNETWIELKIATCSINGNLDIFHKSFEERKMKLWFDDINKLKELKGHRRYFVLIGLYDYDPNEKNGQDNQRLDRLKKFNDETKNKAFKYVFNEKIGDFTWQTKGKRIKTYYFAHIWRKD